MSLLHFKNFGGENALKKTWFETKIINILAPNVLKDCVFQYFCALILIFFLIFHHENVRSHAWPFTWAGMIFFARFWCFLAWKYVVFMTKNSVFTWFFRSKRIKALCFLIIFAWFFELEKKFRKIRFRECRWSFLTRFFLWKYMILERKSMVFQQLCEPRCIPGTWFLVLFLYFFSSEKMHEHETAILYVNRDFAAKKFGVKNRVFGCSRWTLRSQRY